MNKFFLGLLLFVHGFVFAADIPAIMPKSPPVCVGATAAKAYASIIDYDAYHKTKGAVFRQDVIPLFPKIIEKSKRGETAKYLFTRIVGLLNSELKKMEFDQMQMLKMIESRSSFVVSSGSHISKNPETDLNKLAEQDTEAFVHVKLQPLGDDFPPPLPEVYIDCTSQWLDTAKTKFEHECKIITNNQLKNSMIKKGSQNYGLSDFYSKAIVTANDPNCSGKTSLNYKLKLKSNSKEVDAIKDSAGKYLDNKFSLAFTLSKIDPKELVDELFDEVKFFTDYYVNYYEDWIRTLN